MDVVSSLERISLPVAICAPDVTAILLMSIIICVLVCKQIEHYRHLPLQKNKGLLLFAQGVVFRLTALFQV